MGDGSTNYTTTRGNNGIAQANPFGGDDYLDNYRPDSPQDHFVYPYSPSMATPASYINASIVQLFYTVNAYHDLLYLLGFNEKAGNFQWDNNDKGGIGHDYVILDAQTGRDFNDASFEAPADGLPGRMRMTLWTQSTPYRDGSFDAGLVIHEYTHGCQYQFLSCAASLMINFPFTSSVKPTNRWPRQPRLLVRIGIRRHG